MTQTSSNSPLDSGIAVIHSNKLEELSDVVVFWLKEHPLAPLENEVFLVQSNGMGQWLQQSLAQNSALGIATAIKVQLPSSFIWTVYRAVLGAQIPKEQLLAKAPLTWRLYRLLPTLMSQAGFEILSRFLVDDKQDRKRYQLAEQLADLFDQYQVYRSDWLFDWAEGRDCLRDADGQIQSMPEQQHWQAALWRAVLADLGEAATPFASRASVHTLFMSRIEQWERRPAGIPRRIIVFGLSSLPQQALEVLAKLGKFCQIVLFVHNPCQHYWADIIEDKELLKAERHRQAYKLGMAATLTDAELHLHAQPLLAAWGKQGRDYIRLLDHFDETKVYANWHWPDSKIDLFKDYCEPEQGSLLERLQQSILDLEPLPAQPIKLKVADESLAFHVAHSPQREVEILHDQLLDRFNATKDLQPRDVIVMVPDINKYAPHIRAVFGNIKPSDERYISYSLADQQQRGQNPLLLAVETLLNLPDSRFAVSELLGLLEVPALRQRFAIEEAAIPKLHQWVEEAGIRWGLNAKQRAQTVAMPAHLETNTWQFGLRRMLLGYAVGSGEAFNAIEPYDEIGGLEAQWIGGLAHLLEALEKHANLLKQALSSVAWQQTLLLLLEDFFELDSGERDRKTLETLMRSLASWGQVCEQAGLTETDTLPLCVVKEAWLTAVDEPNLQQRFLSGRVNFCTLMPMRAIPFRLICLLGMNDGDYPRSQPAQSFDLMSQRGHYRPGDRSRRQDDHYLFLEALLSARQQLYISWVGRNIRDNSERPPSVLISQLRDTMALGWQLGDNKASLLQSLTVEHPLQPFSVKYLAKERAPHLFTYAREWFAPSDAVNLSVPLTVSGYEKAFTLSLESLGRFLKTPVKAFCHTTLKFGFDLETITSEDNEPFAFNALENYGLGAALLEALQNEVPDNTSDFLEQQQMTMARRGLLPLGGFAAATYARIAEPVQHTWQQYQVLLQLWSVKMEAQLIDLNVVLDSGITVQLTGELINLRQTKEGSSTALIQVISQALLTQKGEIKHPNLLLQWVQHLAACAAGMNIQTLVMASDCVIEIQPLLQKEAIEQLEALVEGWYLGLQAPLPVACKTAFAWLSVTPDKAEEAARFQYEGDDWTRGELAYDAYLARFFPSFAHLMAQGDFEAWAQTLYQSALNHIKRQEPQDEQS